MRNALVLCVLLCIHSGMARRSPNAAKIEEYYVHGPEAGRYSNDLLEDALLDVPGLISKYRYPIEVHNVVTEDGYILEMHRIPHGRDQNNVRDPNKPVVLVQHGMASSSAEFVVTGPGNGLAYVLAEAGFDVWLGNARGNFYSRKHVTLDPDSREPEQFWHFSWEEIGSRDLPAMIDHILSITGKPRLHYIGHSQGTTAFFVMGSLRPEYNAKIISMQAYAPSAYFEHNQHPLFRRIAPYATNLEILARMIGVNEISTHSPLISWMGRVLCSDGAYTQIVCTNLIFIMLGGGPELFNATLLPVIMGHSPAGMAVRQAAHYGQLIGNPYFRRYDHGPLTNWRLYQSFTPPSYDLSLVTAPVFLHYAEVDPFAHLDDVDRLWRELGRPMGKLQVPHPSFGHQDFAWAINVKSILYDKTIDIMLSFSVS